MKYASYDEYLRSEHWQKLRAGYYACHAPCCGCCGFNGLRLSLHHKTYERVGSERISDLIALCDSCHAAVHEIVDRAKRVPGTSTRYEVAVYPERRVWRLVTLETAVNLLRERIGNKNRELRRQAKAEHRAEQRRVYLNKKREKRLAKRQAASRT